MPVANVRSKWTAGNLIFYESVAGNGASVQFGEDGSGMDMVLGRGTTASNYLQWDASANSLLLVGTAVRFSLGSFTGAAIGTGSVVSATATAPFKVFADDGGAAIGSGSLVRAGWFRNLQTYTGGNREQEATGVQGSLVSVAGTNRHNMSGVLGSYEARTSLTVGGQAATTDTWIQAGVLGRVGMSTGTLVVDTNAVLAGVAAMSNINSAVNETLTGDYVGFYVGAWASAIDFEIGLLIEGTKVTQGINVGKHSSTAVGPAVIISATNTAANRFYADDGGASIAIAASVPDVKNTLFRTLITKDNSAYNGRVHSLMGQLKSVDGEWGDEQWSAVHGYLELVQSSGEITLQSYGVTAGVMATVETQGTIGIVVTHNLAGFAAISKLGYTGALTDNTNTSGLYVGIYDSTNWSDSPTLDKWNHGLYVQAAAADKGIQIGEMSSQTQVGLTLVSGSGYEAVSVYSDDGDVTLTGGTPFAGIHTRTMLFQDLDEGTTLIGAWGQLKYYSEVDIGPARVAAVEGYNELLTTNLIKSGGELTCVNAVIDVVAGTATVNSTGIATGFHAKLTGAGEIVQDTGGYLAGLKIDSDITTGQWGYGIYIQAGAVAKAIQVGELSSTTAGSGVALTNAVTRVMEVHADDNDSARTGGIQGRAIFGRTMIYANTTQENWGVDGLLKWSTVAHTGNVNAGVVGRFEAIGTNSTATGIGNTFVAGVMGRIGIASSAFTLGAGTWAVGVLAFYNTLSANNPATGYTAAFMATASDIALHGDWDYGLYIEDTTTGIYIDPAATYGIQIGAGATAAGSGLTVNATAPVGFYFDDGGAALTAWSECFTVGLVLPTASTGASQTGFPSATHIYIDQRANYTGPTTKSMTALWAGYLVRNSSTLDGFDDGCVSAIHASIDIATGCTLEAGTTMGGISFGGNWALGTVSGMIFPLVVVPTNEDWTGFLCLNTGGSDKGLVQDSAATGGSSKYLRVYIQDTLYTIAMTTA